MVTKLRRWGRARQKRGGVGRLFPAAGEVVVALVGDGDKAAPVGSSPPEGVERAALCRARSTARRYCKSNGLDRLWTLTFREAQSDPAEVVRLLGLFFKR